MYFSIWWAGSEIARCYLQGVDISFRNLLLPLISLLINSVILYINTILHYQPVSFGYSPFLELRHFSFALLAVGVAIFWRKAGWTGFDKTIGRFAFLAPVSFGLYISHWFLLSNAHYLDAIVPASTIRLILYTLICIVVAYGVEKIIYPKLSSSLMKLFLE